MSDNITGPSRQLPPVLLEKFLLTQDAVASNQSAAAMNVLEGATNSSNVALGVTSYVAQWPGTIVGVSYHLSSAASAGAMVVAPTINGTAVDEPTVRVTTGTNGYEAATRGAATFEAGDLIGVKLTTSNEWDATTADLLVEVRALVEPSGV